MPFLGKASYPIFGIDHAMTFMSLSVIVTLESDELVAPIAPETASTYVSVVVSKNVVGEEIAIERLRQERCRMSAHQLKSAAFMLVFTADKLVVSNPVAVLTVQTSV